MVNNIYPGTTFQPTQQIDFYLSGNTRVRTVLLIQPPSKNGQILDVHLHATLAGGVVLNPIPSSAGLLTVFQAGARAYQYVQSEAQRLQLQLERVEVSGEEFIEATDIKVIIGNIAPVTVI